MTAPIQPPMPPPQPQTELSRKFRFRWGGRVGALLVRLWGRTLRLEWDVPESVRALERAGQGIVYAHWHAHILTLIYAYRDRGIVVLVSRHADGEYIAQINHGLGFGTVRGSTSRGGLKALLQMAGLGGRGYSLAIAPDGPRGPRHVLQSGLLVIAERCGQPIVPVAVGARRCRRLSSWDRFELPAFFSSVLVTAGEPMMPPDGLSGQDLVEQWGPQVAEAMRRVEARAEAWSQGWRGAGEAV